MTKTAVAIFHTY